MTRVPRGPSRRIMASISSAGEPVRWLTLLYAVWSMTASLCSRQRRSITCSKRSFGISTFTDRVEKPGVILQFVAYFEEGAEQPVTPIRHLSTGQRLQKTSTQLDDAQPRCLKLQSQLVAVILTQVADFAIA